MGRPFTYSKILKAACSGAIFFSMSADSAFTIGGATFNHAQEFLKSLCKMEFKTTEEMYWHWVDFCVRYLIRVDVLKNCAEFLRNLVDTGNLEFFKEIKSLEELEKKLKDFKKPPREEMHSGRKEMEDLLPKIVKNIENYFLSYLKGKPGEALREYWQRFNENMVQIKKLFSNSVDYTNMNFAKSLRLVRAVYCAGRDVVTVDPNEKSKLIFSSDIVYYKTNGQCSGHWVGNIFYYTAGACQEEIYLHEYLWQWILKTIEENNSVSTENENLVKDKYEEKNEDKINLMGPEANEQKNPEESKGTDFLNKKHHAGEVSDKEWKATFTQSMGKKTGTINVASKQNFVKNKKEEDGIDLDEENNDEGIKKFDNEKADKKGRNVKKEQNSIIKSFDKEKQLTKYTLNYFIMDMNNQSKLLKAAINGPKNSLQNNNNVSSEMVLEDNSSDKEQDLYKFYDLERKNVFSAQKIEGLKYKSNEFIPSLPF